MDTLKQNEAGQQTEMKTTETTIEEFISRTGTKHWARTQPAIDGELFSGPVHALCGMTLRKKDAAPYTADCRFCLKELRKQTAA